MSSEKHPNLQMHKWAPTDYVKREEWNENFGIIDDKIGILFKRADLVSVKEFGAKGDGVTDDTTAIQNALDSVTDGIIYFPKGKYKISNTLTFKPGHKIIGASRSGTIITMTDDTKYVFQFLSSSTGDIDSGIVFESLTINAKYGIKLNESGDYTTVFSKQQAIKGVIFNNLKLEGKYTSASDVNYNTTVIPTRSEMEGYGVGIRGVKLYNTVIKNSQIQSFGIGIHFDGCGVSYIDNVRLFANGWHVDFYGHDTWGGSLKVLNCDILFNRRIPAINIEDCTGVQVEKNYFENYDVSAQYVRITKGKGITISKNHFSNTKQANTPAFSINPYFDVKVSDNIWIPGGAIPPIEVKGDYWSKLRPRLVHWINNSSQMPQPKYPAVQIGDYNPYLFRFDNINPMVSGIDGSITTAGIPFVLSATTGRYVLRTDLGNAFVFFNLQDVKHRKLLIKLTGRRVAGNGYHVVTYQETGFPDVELYRGSTVGFSKTDEVETKSYTVKLPDDRKGGGTLKFELVCSEVEYESIEIIPVDYELGTAPPTSGTYKVGDKIYNSNPTAGGYEGWICVTAGTPGTWKGFGAIQT